MSISEYERLQIDALLRRGNVATQPNTGMFLMPREHRSRLLFEAAVLPAMRRCGLEADAAEVAFDSKTALSDVHRWLLTAEVIIADLTVANADLFYVLGLCHGVGRCPILLTTQAMELPFNMPELRCVEYRPTERGIFDLRQDLERVLRVFLAAARATGGGP